MYPSPPAIWNFFARAYSEQMPRRNCRNKHPKLGCCQRRCAGSTRRWRKPPRALQTPSATSPTRLSPCKIDLVTSARRVLLVSSHVPFWGFCSLKVCRKEFTRVEGRLEELTRERSQTARRHPVVIYVWFPEPIIF